MSPIIRRTIDDSDILDLMQAKDMGQAAEKRLARCGGRFDHITLD